VIGYGRQLVVVALSLAVLLASSTCTQAGCLLSVASASPLSHSERTCCSRHTGIPAHDGGRRECPPCHNSILIAKGVENSSSGNLHLLPSPLFLLTAFDGKFAAPPVHERLASLDRTSLPSCPASTLLALHCALLN
jgi:hypothetical protein